MASRPARSSPSTWHCVQPPCRVGHTRHVSSWVTRPDALEPRVSWVRTYLGGGERRYFRLRCLASGRFSRLLAPRVRRGRHGFPSRGLSASDGWACPRVTMAALEPQVRTAWARVVSADPGEYVLTGKLYRVFDRTPAKRREASQGGLFRPSGRSASRRLLR